MKTEELHLALPVPKNRVVWILANISTTNEAETTVEPYEGAAQWNEKAQTWVDRRGLAIAVNFDSEIYILEWKELGDRAAGAPASEHAISGNVYHWDDEYRRQMKRNGFYALLKVTHEPTWVYVADRTEGPFLTQADALDALATMLAAYRHLSVASEERRAA